jgi:hypothetical protein
MGFLYEDYLYLSCLDKQIVTHYVSSFLFKNVDHPYPNPRPAMRIFWYLNSKIFGYDNVFAFHLINLTLHIIAALLLFNFLCMLYSDKKVAFLSSIIFSSLTCNAEIVSWLCCGWYIMTAILMLVSLMILKKIRESEKAKYSYLLLILTVLIAYMINEISISLPLVLLFFDLIYWRMGTGKGFLKRISIYILLFIIGYLLFFKVQIRENFPNVVFNFLVEPNVPFPTLTDLFYHFLGISIHFMMQFKILLEPFKFTMSLLIFFVLLFRTDFKKIGFFIGWYFLSLIPIILIITLGGRLVYITSIGFSIILAHVLTNGVKIGQRVQSPWEFLIDFFIYVTIFWLSLTLKVILPIAILCLLFVLKQFVYKWNVGERRSFTEAGNFVKVTLIVIFVLMQSYSSINRNIQFQKMSIYPTPQYRQINLDSAKRLHPVDNLAALAPRDETIFEHNKEILDYLLERK